MRKILIISLLLACTQAFAADFDFNDPKGVNSISFNLDSPLEPIVGLAKDISGKVSYSADKPGTTQGKISFPTGSLVLSSARMTGVLHGEDWLDAESNPTVSFEFTHDGSDFKGTMTLAGVSKPFEAPGSVTLVQGGAASRGAGEGDLLVLRSKFQVNRSAFGIKPGVLFDKVADNIDVIVAIVGYPAK